MTEDEEYAELYELQRLLGFDILGLKLTTRFYKLSISKSIRFTNSYGVTFSTTAGGCITGTVASGSGYSSITSSPITTSGIITVPVGPTSWTLEIFGGGSN